MPGVYEDVRTSIKCRNASPQFPPENLRRGALPGRRTDRNCTVGKLDICKGGLGRTLKSGVEGRPEYRLG
jgi:hypothetical protein